MSYVLEKKREKNTMYTGGKKYKCHKVDKSSAVDGRKERKNLSVP